ncbi:MAG TPA: DUF3224 domain-containing protein [Arachidicoccus sp.]|nr:DUF3224 domain-containing protein [Arachidicoccus sp.]
MDFKATGTFEVNIIAQTDREIPMLFRMTIDKIFKGDIVGVTQGQMLSAKTTDPKSAGYVAIERVEGVLQGKKGSFVLQHSGIMNKGVPSLTIVVVPGSGTNELAGLSGELSINITDGKHFYEFNYSLP